MHHNQVIEIKFQQFPATDLSGWLRYRVLGSEPKILPLFPNYAYTVRLAHKSSCENWAGMRKMSATLKRECEEY